MRLIDGDALVETMQADEPEVWLMYDAYSLGLHDQYLYDLTAVEAAPTAGGWISVKDRLPETQDWYLVFAPTYSGGSSTSREHHRGVMFAKWSGKSWSIERCYYNRPDCVKAWMPIPKPYKPSKED